MFSIFPCQLSAAQVPRPNLQELADNGAEGSSEPLPLPAPETSEPSVEPLPLPDQGTSDQEAGKDVSQGTAPAAADAESESATSHLIQSTNPESRTSCPDSRNKSPDLVEAQVEVKETSPPQESHQVDAGLKQIRDFWQRQIKIKQEPIDEGRAPLQTGEPTPFEDL